MGEEEIEEIASKWLSIFVFKYIAFVLLIVFVVSCSRIDSLTNEDAKHAIDFPLVPSATNVFFYEEVGGLQSLDRYIRFDVAKQDITNQINLIIADDNHKLGRSLSYLKTNINPSDIITQTDEGVKLPWWTPEKITNGYYQGENVSYASEIWVDDSTGTLFIHVGD